MAGRCLAGIGRVIVAILKAIAWLLLNALQLVLNVAKVFLLLLGLVGRLFLAFVRAGTPQEGGDSYEDLCKLSKEPQTGTVFLQNEETCSIMEGDQYAPDTGQTQS